MIYLQSPDSGTTLIVLEAGNLERMKAGRPAVTPDKKVVIAFTPDPVWLADKLMDCDGSAAAVAALIEEASKRSQKDPDRPKHATHLHKFLKGE